MSLNFFNNFICRKPFQVNDQNKTPHSQQESSVPDTCQDLTTTVAPVELVNKLDHQRSKIPEVVQLQPVLPDGDEINGVMDKYEIDKTTPEDENLSVLPLE